MKHLNVLVFLFNFINVLLGSSRVKKSTTCTSSTDCKTSKKPPLLPRTPYTIHVQLIFKLRSTMFCVLRCLLVRPGSGRSRLPCQTGERRSASQPSTVCWGHRPPPESAMYMPTSFYFFDILYCFNHLLNDPLTKSSPHKKKFHE